MRGQIRKQSLKEGNADIVKARVLAGQCVSGEAKGRSRKFREELKARLKTVF